MMKPLLRPQVWEEVLGPFRKKKVAFFYDQGNVGDQLIYRATLQLFKHYEIEIAKIPESRAILYGGGGNMGRMYSGCYAQRIELSRISRTFGIPFVILPQSWTSLDDVDFDIAYRREEHSRALCPRSIFAPDLALGYTPEMKMPSAAYATGFYFRRDGEQQRKRRFPQIDPVHLASTPESYLLLAAQYKSIHTDRLHFAIAGLIARRNVTLYANSYHKNRAVWESSLSELGCSFSEHIPTL